MTPPRQRFFSGVAGEALGFGRALDSFIIFSRGLLQAACAIFNFNLSLLQPLFPGTPVFPAFEPLKESHLQDTCSCPAWAWNEGGVGLFPLLNVCDL